MLGLEYGDLGAQELQNVPEGIFVWIAGWHGRTAG